MAYMSCILVGWSFLGLKKVFNRIMIFKIISGVCPFICMLQNDYSD